MYARTAVVLLALAAAVSAQSLNELQQRFAAEMRALQQGGERPSREQAQQLLKKQAETLAAFLPQAKGDDRWNGVLMLADIRIGSGDRPGAQTALRGMDPKQAPAMVLLAGAEMAGRLQLDDLRKEWIDAAIQKDAPFEQRMAMGRLLMTVLREVERGEKVFADAIAAAKDDEGRAAVRWNRADAIRDREDLDDNAYFDELDKLAKDLPDTYFGSVARDRSLAARFKVGSAAIPFAVKTTDGKDRKFGDWQGKVLLLAFWAASDPTTPELIITLKQLAAAGGESVAVLGIAIDRDVAKATAAGEQFHADFPLVIDGKGWQNDLALRYFVKTTPTVIVIGRDGKIAGLNLHTGTKDAKDDLQHVVEQARKQE